MTQQHPFQPLRRLALAATVALGAAHMPMAVAADAPLKAAWVYVGPVGDGGWTFAHDNGRKTAVAALGARLETTYVESVPENADAERVIRDLASQGNKLIFGTTFGYMLPMYKLSREFPDVRFEHATGYRTAANMRTYDSRTYQGAYMAGVIAGAMTKTNTLGVVGSISIPEVLRNINAFTMGARSVNPKAQTKVVWVDKWFDPPREAEAAQALIDQGADVLFQNTDSSAVLQTAEKAGKYAFGWDSDMSHYGPKAHLASAVINWGPYYTKAVNDVVNGTWKTGSAWWGVAEGAIDIVSISDVVPGPTREQVAKVKQGLADGSFKIWRGPITDNTGKTVIADGQVADDRFLGGMNFYVKGVEGKPPSGN
ncbi:MAG: BMP family ABC transporter substrate-binding protein [Burkholderiaceae bacterium]